VGVHRTSKGSYRTAGEDRGGIKWSDKFSPAGAGARTRLISIVTAACYSPFYGVVFSWKHPRRPKFEIAARRLPGHARRAACLLPPVTRQAATLFYPSNLRPDGR
jgi:hypothetical protein